MRIDQEDLFLPYCRSPSGTFWFGLVPGFIPPTPDNKQGRNLFRALRKSERERVGMKLPAGERIEGLNETYQLWKAEVSFIALPLPAAGLCAVPPRSANSVPIWFMPHEQMETLDLETTTQHAMQRLLAALIR